MGDINQDSVIDILDVVLIINFILGQENPNTIEEIASDLNSDGIINIQDVILILNIILIGSLFSQNEYDVLRPFWGFDHSQILSNSIGGATVASGYITPGLSSNPANLAATQFGYVQVNFSNSEFSSLTSDMSHTGFNGFDYVQPVPVYRGRLVFSVGGHKQIDYMSASQNASYDSSEKGKLSS